MYNQRENASVRFTFDSVKFYTSIDLPVSRGDRGQMKSIGYMLQEL